MQNRPSFLVQLVRTSNPVTCNTKHLQSSSLFRHNEKDGHEIASGARPPGMCPGVRLCCACCALRWAHQSAAAISDHRHHAAPHGSSWGWRQKAPMGVFRDRRGKEGRCRGHGCCCRFLGSGGCSCQIWRQDIGGFVLSLIGGFVLSLLVGEFIISNCCASRWESSASRKRLADRVRLYGVGRTARLCEPGGLWRIRMGAPCASHPWPLRRTELCAHPAYTSTHPTPPIPALGYRAFSPPPDVQQSYSRGSSSGQYYGGGRGRISDRTDVVLCCVSSAVFYSLDRSVEELAKV